MEGTVASVHRRVAASTRSRIPPGRHHNILFICGGAFSGLERIIGARGKGSGIGYGAEVRAVDERRMGAVLREVEPEDLLKFGLIRSSSAACRWSPRWRPG